MPPALPHGQADIADQPQSQLRICKSRTHPASPDERSQSRMQGANPGERIIHGGPILILLVWFVFFASQQNPDADGWEDQKENSYNGSQPTR